MTDLSLRVFQKPDIPELFSWFSSEREVLEWAGAQMPWPLEAREFKRLIKEHRRKRPTRSLWAVWTQQRMIGHFQLGLNRRLRTIGLGRIGLAPTARGRGLGHTLVQLALQQAFSERWAHRVELMVYDHNQAAIKTYQHAGFVLEGTRRQTTPIHDEVWDTHIMSLLRPEYKIRFDRRTERE